MAYSADFYRLTALFSINTTSETAAFDLTVSDGTPGTLPPLDQAAADSWAALVDTFLQNTAPQRAAYSRFTGVKLAHIGTNGKYVDEPVIAEATNARPGSAQQLPPQLSIVVTLRSASSLGKGNYGRFYVPYCGAPELNLPRLTTSDRNSFLLNAQTLVDGTNDLFGSVVTNRKVRIMSQAAGGSTAKLVTQVGVGRVIDTQRRRRRSLEEDYSYLAV